eukprot:COSAG02_NODE_2597_length_8456_cov_4.666866_1_plen_65_part_00
MGVLNALVEWLHLSHVDSSDVIEEVHFRCQEVVSEGGEREDSISTRFMVGDLSAYCKGQYATRS